MSQFFYHLVGCCHFLEQMKSEYPNDVNIMMYNLPLRFKSNVCDFKIKVKKYIFYGDFSIVIIIGIMVVMASMRSS
jgi:hypothetical protein